MQIEIPAFLSHLKVDPRGYPIPYFVAKVKEVFDFRMIDGKKMNYCLLQDLCFICGKKHFAGSYYFLTGPIGLENRIHSDCPSHKDCMEYAIKTCPHLAFEKATRNERGELVKVLSATTGAAGIKEKPDTFFLIKADKYFSVPGPNGGLLISFRPVKTTAYKYQSGTLEKIAL